MALEQTKTSVNEGRSTQIGFLQGLVCYVIWGNMPVYWKLLSSMPALQVLAWRMLWSCLCLLALCVFIQRAKFAYLFRQPRAVRTFVISALIVTANWGIFVWATNSGHVLETSIGYYLCPLFSIILGLVVFKERLSAMQKLATLLAGIGVLYFLMTHGGTVWISFALALTFSVYGAVKKKGAYPALPGMAFESLLAGVLGTTALVVGGIAPWLWQLTPATPDAIAISSPTSDFILLIGCGILTAIPLLLYSGAANRINMSLIGFLQYLSPTITLFLAVTFFGEELSPAHLICFTLIWFGIAAVAAESFWLRKCRRSVFGKSASSLELSQNSKIGKEE